MSYNNNWLKTLSESYIKNARKSNIKEDLNEQIAFNESLLTIIEVLCEELGIDAEGLINEAVTVARHKEHEAKIQQLQDAGDYEGSYDAEDAHHEELRSDKVHGEGGTVVHSGHRGLGWKMAINSPSDEDVGHIQDIVKKVGHIVTAAPDDAYATSSDDIKTSHPNPDFDARPHPVVSRLVKASSPKKTAASEPAKPANKLSASSTDPIGRFSSASKKN